MKQIKIRDKEYNCSNKVYYHIQGLESENRVISMELLGHENNELQQQKEIERLNNIIEKYKKHLEDIDKWLDYNTEIGNLYWYDSTPFPKLEIDGSDKE